MIGGRIHSQIQSWKGSVRHFYDHSRGAYILLSALDIEKADDLVYGSNLALLWSTTQV